MGRERSMPDGKASGETTSAKAPVVRGMNSTVEDPRLAFQDSVGNRGALLMVSAAISGAENAKTSQSEPYLSQVPGAFNFVLSPAERYADQVARADYLYALAEDAATGILKLIPAYIRARDARDPLSVGEISGRLLGAFDLMHGAQGALDQVLRVTKRRSIAGTSTEDELARAKTLDAVDAKVPLLKSLIAAADGMTAFAVTPHMFRGNEVAGEAIVVDLGSPRWRGMRLAAELERTMNMLLLVDELTTSLLVNKGGLDRPNLVVARRKLAPWASRPLDLAFLRAALGPIWDLLDATATEPLDWKPTDMLADATKQAAHTGWLGDIGKFDIMAVSGMLQMGGRESAEFALSQLYTADPDARAMLLMQLKKRKLLDRLCSAVGWAEIKALHDSLGIGFAEIKTDLQSYFLGRGKWGPSLDSEWDGHDNSFHSLVGRLGGFGKVLNFALDVGTFGFHSSYGRAVDDHSRGLTSDAEMHDAKAHAAMRTIVVGAASILTGGLADKAIRGGAGTVSALRATGAGAAGGSAGGVTALATSDVYNIYISGEQTGFSSPEEYVKATLLGGVIGGTVGGVTQGLSNRASRYVGEPVVAPFRAPNRVGAALVRGLRNAEIAPEFESAGSVRARRPVPAEVAPQSPAVNVGENQPTPASAGVSDAAPATATPAEAPVAAPARVQGDVAIGMTRIGEHAESAAALTSRRQLRTNMPEHGTQMGTHAPIGPEIVTAIRGVPVTSRDPNVLIGADTERFMEDALKIILADPNHPAALLVDYQQRTWRVRPYQHGNMTLWQQNPSHGQSGHALSNNLGGADVIIWQSAYRNQIQSARLERHGAVAKDSYYNVGGISFDPLTVWDLFNQGLLAAPSSFPKHKL